MTEITPYPIEIPDSALGDLKARLALTRFPEAETVDDWSQGLPLSYAQELAAYWASDYDWRKCEDKLNAFGSFKTEINGLDIQFLHVRSKHENAKPLILTHGWPGSIVEFFKAIPALTDPTAHGGTEDDAFHLVIPSMPGYGFSEKPTEPGWTVDKIADAWAQLMARLGYDAYLAQGGDWGSAVSIALGKADPDHCKAVHVNMVVVPPDQETFADLTDYEKQTLADAGNHQEWGTGYSKQQSTRPQTLGYGLVDSPMGQASWIIEKFWQWTDCDGHPENTVSRDELLDNVMLYWLTAAGASSARLYWESFRNFAAGGIDFPIGCSLFPKEIFRPSRRWADKVWSNIIYWNELDKGGHFAAMEQPELFVSELRACFGQVAL